MRNRWLGREVAEGVKETHGERGGGEWRREMGADGEQVCEKYVFLEEICDAKRCYEGCR